MVHNKILKGIAGVSVLFAAITAHAQTDTSTQSTRDGTTPTTTRDPSSNTTQSGSSSAGSTMQSATSPQSRLQQGVMQSSTRQSGTQQTGLEAAGRFDKGSTDAGVPPAGSARTQAGSSQAGATQSGAWDAGSQKADPSTVPSITDRSRQAQDARSGVTPETMGRSGAAGTAGGSLNKADSTAIMDMAMANLAEVEMGKMAQSKGTSEQVKSFGQQMVDDHGKGLSEVQALAQAKGVTLPTELDAKHRKEADRLNAMSGAAFDKAYMERAGVKDHKAVHAKLNNIASSARDPDVRALAAKMQPVVQEHLNSAKQMGKSTR